MQYIIRNLSYEERLLSFKLTILILLTAYRGDVLTIFQILNGYVDLKLDATEFFNFYTTTHTNGHSYNINSYTRHIISDVRKRYNCSRVIKKWNSLPSNVVEATSINDFKNKFDSNKLFWKNII